MKFFRVSRGSNLTIGLAAGVALLTQFPSEAASKGSKGATSPSAQTLYAQKNFVAASKAFYKKVVANPSDAESYYFLGNCAVAMKNYSQALEYYKRASDLQPESTIGAYSKTAIGRVNDMINPPKPKADIASKAKVVSSEEGDDDKTEKADKKDPKAAAVEAQALAKIAEGDKAAQKVLDEATLRSKPIKDEEDREAADATLNQGRMANTESGNQGITDLRAPYEERIKALMEPAKRRAQQYKDAAKKEADAIRQAASSKK